MSKFPAHGTRILLDQYDISGYVNSFDLPFAQETPDVTSFADAGPRRVVGNYDYSSSVLGFFDGADDAVDEILHGLLANESDHYLTKMPGASAEGGIAYDLLVSLTRKPLSAATGGAVLLNIESAGRNGAVRGHILGNLTSTGAGNRAGVNQGVKASGVVYAVIFRVLSFTGTNITLKIQESSDDGAGDAYADVASLTSGALTAIGVVRATTTAAMEAWRRLNISGTFTSVAVRVTAGVVAGSA